MKNNVAILFLFANAITALVLYHFLDADHLFYTTVLAMVSSFIALVINKDNVVYLLRMIVIVWIGLIPVLAVLQGGYFALRMPYIQTTDVAWVFSILVTMSLFSAQLGFALSDRRVYRKYTVDFGGQTRVIFWLVFVLVLAVGTLISIQRGELVFFARYSSLEQGGVDLPVNNLQAICGGLLIVLFILAVRITSIHRSENLLVYRNKYFIALIFAVLYVTLWAQFLRGARMDPIGIFFGLFVMSKAVNGDVARLNFRSILIAVVGLVVIQVWGAARGMLGSGIGLSEIITSILEKDPQQIKGVAVMYFQGTFNNISVGVAGIIHALQTGLTEYWYGKSYLEFIPRIPPQFLYPDRPESLAWFSEWVYGDSSGGGMNEMGEVYLNFGIYGSLFVPGIISFIIGWSYRRCLANPFNLWVSLPFIGILAVYLRGLLYQTFDAFKSYITMLILYAMIWLVYQLIACIRRNSNVSNYTRHA